MDEVRTREEYENDRLRKYADQIGSIADRYTTLLGMWGRWKARSLMSG